MVSFWLRLELLLVEQPAVKEYVAVTGKPCKTAQNLEGWLTASPSYDHGQ